MGGWGLCTGYWGKEGVECGDRAREVVDYSSAATAELGVWRCEEGATD